jgi:poly(A) polymerase
LGKWWEAFQRVNPAEREAMLLVDEAPKKRRRSRARRKPASAGEPELRNESEMRE